MNVISKSPILWILILSAAPLPATATQGYRRSPVNAPRAVDQAARLFASRYCPLAARVPALAEVRTNQRTGTPIWELTLRSEQAYVRIDIDSTSGQVVRFQDYRKDDEVRNSVKSGRTASVAREAAISAVTDILRSANATSGDWRVIEANLSEWTEDMLGWTIRLHRYVRGIPCELDRVYAIVSPFSPSVQSFFLEDGAIRLPQRGRLFGAEAARRVATDAFRRFAGDALQPTDDVKSVMWIDELLWVPLSHRSPVCRLGYRYIFKLEEITHGRYDAGYEAVVDAQTGELWWLRIITGGGHGINGKPVDPNARIGLAAKLLDEPSGAAFGRALAAGDPAKSTKPPIGTALRKVTVGNATYEFHLNLSEKTLSWRRADGGQWASIRLPESEARELEKGLTPAPDSKPAE